MQCFLQVFSQHLYSMYQNIFVTSLQGYQYWRRIRDESSLVGLDIVAVTYFPVKFREFVAFTKFCLILGYSS